MRALELAPQSCHRDISVSLKVLDIFLENRSMHGTNSRQHLMLARFEHAKYFIWLCLPGNVSLSRLGFRNTNIIIASKVLLPETSILTKEVPTKNLGWASATRFEPAAKKAVKVTCFKFVGLQEQLSEMCSRKTLINYSNSYVCSGKMKYHLKYTPSLILLFYLFMPFLKAEGSVGKIKK